MTPEYEAYLQSDTWRQKRTQRLEIGKNRCAACHDRKALHVHHLTYARIFNEEMSDLIPLCGDHHTVIEKLIRSGKLSRQGDTLFLLTETVRLILSEKSVRKETQKREKRTAPVTVQSILSLDPRNNIQEKLVKDPMIIDLITAKLSRIQVRKRLRFIYKGRSDKGAFVHNALILHKRFTKKV